MGACPQDKAEADAHAAATLGTWALDPGTGYLYNALHRYYFDITTGAWSAGTQIAQLPVQVSCPASVRWQIVQGQPGAQGQLALSTRSM